MNNSANIVEVCKFERRGDLALSHPAAAAPREIRKPHFRPKNLEIVPTCGDRCERPDCAAIGGGRCTPSMATASRGESGKPAHETLELSDVGV